jgi:hypothetical protein
MLHANGQAEYAMRSGLIRGVLVVAALLSCSPGMAADNWVAAWGDQQLMKPERAIPRGADASTVERQTVRGGTIPPRSGLRVSCSIRSATGRSASMQRP